MKKLILISILKIIIYSNLIAQQNFQPGYIILNSGDTINGTIDNKYWKKNPLTIDFKNSENKVQTFDVTDLSGFKVEKTIYQSEKVQIEQSPQQLKNLNTSREAVFEEKIVFLEIIIDGNKSLYLYRGNQERDHFYIKRDGKIEALVYKKFNLGDVNNIEIGYNKQFILQLQTYLSDCPDIVNEISTYEEPAIWKLKKLYEKYYNCTLQKPAFQKVDDKMKIEFGLNAGLTYATIQFNGEGGKLTGSNFSSSVNPTFGIFLNMGLKGNRNRWALHNALMYTSYNSEGSYTNNLREGFYNEYEMKLGASYIKLLNLIKYSLQTNEYKDLYLQIGISNAFAIDVENTAVESRYVFDEVTVQDVEVMETYRKYEQGLVLGIGYRLNKLFLDLKVERANGLSEVTAISSPVNRIYTTIGYSF